MNILSHPRYSDTNWERIDFLFKLLKQIKPGDLTNFHHAVIQAEWIGPEKGLDLLESITTEFLQSKPFFYLAKGDWLLQLGNYNLAKEAYSRALSASESDSERIFIQKKN